MLNLSMVIFVLFLKEFSFQKRKSNIADRTESQTDRSPSLTDLLIQESKHLLTQETIFQEDGIVSVPALRKGVLLQARDRLFSRWKERYFVLTRDYLACFRRGSTKYSEMGSFIFKVRTSRWIRVCVVLNGLSWIGSFLAGLSTSWLYTCTVS